MTETARGLAEQIRYRLGHLREYLTEADESILGDQTRLYAVEEAARRLLAAVDASG